MAAALGPIAGEMGLEIFKYTFGQITTIIGNNKGDKEFRNAWTQQALGVVSKANPGKNCVIVYPKHDASKLQGVEQSLLQCENPSTNTNLTYQCYVFDEGEFVLQGDG